MHQDSVPELARQATQDNPGGGDPFRLFVESVYDDAIYVIDPQGVVTTWNVGGERVKGWKADEIIGKHFSVFFTPEDVAEGKPQHQLKVAASEGRCRGQSHRVRKDGSRFWADVTLTAIRNEAGRLTGYGEITRDITDRQRAEQALRESEQRFRALVTATSEVVYRMSSDWSEMRQLRGRGFIADTEAPNRNWLQEYIHPNDQARVLEAINEAIRNKSTFELEHQVRTVDGSLGWTFSRAIPLFDEQDKVVEWFGAAADVTVSKRAAEAQRESEERLRMARDAARMGIHEWRPATGELIWDARTRELFGAGPDDQVNYEVFMSRLHPDDRASTQAEVDRALDPKGTGQFVGEYRVIHPDRTIWVAATGKVTFEHGRAVRLVGTVQDITESKAFQAELQRLVNERTAKLHEALAEMEHISYSLIHDIRAPLRAMHHFAAEVDEANAGHLTAESSESLRRIMLAAERLDRLITEALSYDRVVRQEFALTPVELAGLLRDMLEAYPNLQPPLAEIRIGFQEIYVLGNPALLTQCFSNLLGNAVKFVAAGAKPVVQVEAEVKAETVRIWVTDNGIGIPTEAYEKIFGMFQRLHHEKQYPGTGSGLAIVRKAVQRMGGQVGLESEPGAGSRFWIELKTAPFTSPQIRG